MSTLRTPRYHHVHYIAALLLAAVVLVAMLAVRQHKRLPQPGFETPRTVPVTPR